MNKKAMIIITPPKGRGEKKVVESEAIIFFSLDHTKKRVSIATGFTGESDTLTLLLVGLEQNVLDLLDQVAQTINKQPTAEKDLS